MNKYMKFSVVIPVYNVEKYIRKCINSVLTQSYQNKEIILVNDGSTDNSGEICREYAEKYDFIKLINKQNGGLSDARNTGINHSSGDYILFLDSDDFWVGDFMSELVHFIKENSEPEFVLYNYQYYYQSKNAFIDHGESIGEYELKDRLGITWLDRILKENKNFQWYAWRGLVKKSFLEEKQLYFEVGRNFEDVLWTPQVFIEAKSVAYFNRKFYVYRLEREGQITQDFSKKNLEDNIYIANIWYKKVSVLDIDKNLKIRLLDNIVTRFFVSIWFLSFLSGTDKQAVKKLLEDSNHLLNFDRDIIKKITKILCKLIGFNYCSIIFKCLILMKRKLLSSSLFSN